MATDEQLLFIGSTCHLDSCRLNDFLPLTCTHCSHTFCSSHFLPAAHTCEKWDASAHDRIAPDCPLCGIPVAYPVGGDPNVAMEKHFRSACGVMGGRVASKTGTMKCATPRCNKVLVAPILCQFCGRHHCPEHRFPASHHCSSLAKQHATASSSSNQASAKLGAPKATKPSSAKSAVSASHAKAIPSANQAKAAPSASQAKHGLSTTGKPEGSQAPKLAVPFSKTDRRARAEQRSAEIALRERARKGLLSPEEKIRFAQMEAARAQRQNKDNQGCIVS